MSFRDRYAELQDPAFVRQMLVQSVYGSMHLENQGVSLQRLEEIYDRLQQEQAATLPSQMTLAEPR